MAPSQAARLAAVFIALTIVIGAAGYGIGRGMQDWNEETVGPTACEIHLQQLQEDVREERMTWEEAAQYGVLLEGASARCTCKDLQDLWPRYSGGFVDCVEEP